MCRHSLLRASPLPLVALLAWLAPPSLAQVRLLATDEDTDSLIEVDPATGAHTVIGPVGDPFPGALAWDPVNEILYAASTGDHELLRIDIESGAGTTIGPFGGSYFMHGLEFDSTTGTLYGHGALDNTLYRIDVNSGAATAVGPTGLTGANFGSLAYDPDTGTMYLGHTGTGSLYRVDLEDGAATVIGPFVNAERLVGMAWHREYGLLATDNRGTSSPPDLLYRLDTESGMATFIANINVGNALGLAFVGGADCDPCDTNCDGVLDAFDIEPFIGLLLGGASPCAACAGDVNGDGVIDAFDIEPFINCLIP